MRSHVGGAGGAGVADAPGRSSARVEDGEARRARPGGAGRREEARAVDDGSVLPLAPSSGAARPAARTCAARGSALDARLWIQLWLTGDSATFSTVTFITSATAPAAKNTIAPNTRKETISPRASRVAYERRRREGLPTVSAAARSALASSAPPADALAPCIADIAPRRRAA